MEKPEIYEITDNAFLPYSDVEALATLPPCSTVSEMWEFCVRTYGDKCAVVDGQSFTYAQLDADVRAFRGALAAAGVKREELVGIALDNSYDFVKAFLSVITLGATAVLLPPGDDDILDTFAERTALEFIVSDGERTLPKGTIFIDADATGESLSAVKTNPADGCAVIFTGGRSGKTKGALLSHRAVMRGTLNGCYGYKGIIGERYFAVIPFTHVFGLIRNVLTAFYTGSSVYICRQLQSMFCEMREFKPTVLVLVPALLEAASRLAHRTGGAYFGGEVKNIVVGGAACPAELVQAYADMGIKVHNGYGLTESANLVCGNPVSIDKPGSIGLPYPGQKLKIVDGELWLKGDNLFDGYIGAEDGDDCAFNDGWFMTGDIIERDADGFLYFRGVKKRVIVLPNGENISPGELAEKFGASPYLSSVSVFLLENEYGKKELTLECTLAQAATESDARVDIMRINGALPTHKRISKIIFIGETI